MKLSIKKEELKSGTFVQLRQWDRPNWMVVKGTLDGDILAETGLSGIMAVSLDYYDENLKFLGKYARTERILPEDLRPDEGADSNKYDIVGIYENACYVDFFNGDRTNNLIPLWREGIDYPKLSEFQRLYLQKLCENTNYKFICGALDECYLSVKFRDYEEFKADGLASHVMGFGRADEAISKEFYRILREEVYSIKELLVNG